MFPEPTELLLIGCSIESIWIPRSKSNTLTPKTNSQTIYLKRISHVNEWNHLLSLFTISHFSSTACSAAMAKRVQQESGEERITAKSRLMMNSTARMLSIVLIARVPSNVSSSTSASPVKRSYGNQNQSSIAKKEDRSGRPDIGIDRLKGSYYKYHEQFMESFSSACYSKWDDDRSWSSQEWKTDSERSVRPDETSWRTRREIRPGFSHEETHHDGTAQSVVNEVILRERPGRPDVDSQGGAWPQQFVIGNDEADLESSVESRSFVNRVNGSGAIKTETNFKCYRRWRETFYDLGNVQNCNKGISCIHGKELLEQLSIHWKHNRSQTQTNVRRIYKIGV